jgi:signal-transduction protein with cAMP-binding, CBS, and nucleotidyltransferase domain
MYASKSVSEVLHRKGQGYWAVSPHTTAYDALELMAEKNIGALMVMDEKRLIGMFSERDYARKVILKGKSSRTTSVQELMSSPPICATPGMNLRECMALMTSNHIRHAPVVENGVVLGLLSLGDVVAATIADQEEVIIQMENYIVGDDYTPALARSHSV